MIKATALVNAMLQEVVKDCDRESNPIAKLRLEGSVNALRVLLQLLTEVWPDTILSPDEGKGFTNAFTDPPKL